MVAVTQPWLVTSDTTIATTIVHSRSSDWRRTLGTCRWAPARGGVFATSVRNSHAIYNRLGHFFILFSHGRKLGTKIILQSEIMPQMLFCGSSSEQFTHYNWLPYSAYILIVWRDASGVCCRLFAECGTENASNQTRWGKFSRYCNVLTNKPSRSLLSSPRQESVCNVGSCSHSPPPHHVSTLCFVPTWAWCRVARYQAVKIFLLPR